MSKLSEDIVRAAERRGWRYRGASGAGSHDAHAFVRRGDREPDDALLVDSWPDRREGLEVSFELDEYENEEMNDMAQRREVRHYGWDPNPRIVRSAEELDRILDLYERGRLFEELGSAEDG